MFKRLLLSLSVVFNFSLLADKGNIHVFYGDLKKGQMAIIERVFKPELKRLKNKEPVEKVIEWNDGKIEDFLSVLKDPKTLGVLFLGHPAIKTEGIHPDKKIIHGFLKSGDGFYLPKNIFSAVHDELKFISIMTCHESAILPLYMNSMPSHVDVIKSPTHGLDTLDNPLFEFTSFYSTPEVLKNLEKKLEGGSYREFNFLEEKSSRNVKVVYRDLVSSRFTYTVEADGKVVGILKKEMNKRGRILNKFEKVVKIKNKSKVNLKIHPDDPFRPVAEGLKVVDDILIDDILIQTGYDFQSVLEKRIHLGDQEESPDKNEGLGFLRNLEDFKKAYFSLFWEGSL